MKTVIQLIIGAIFFALFTYLHLYDQVSTQEQVLRTQFEEVQRSSEPEHIKTAMLSSIKGHHDLMRKNFYFIPFNTPQL